MSFKFNVGDLVYGWDAYRGIIGKIGDRYEKGIHHADCYLIDIIKKTQQSFLAKRWDDERFWENEISPVKQYSHDECELEDGRIIKIMSDEEILKAQSKMFPGPLIQTFKSFMTKIPLILFLLGVTSCASAALSKQSQIEDCVVNHLRVLVRHEKTVNEEFYETVVNSCKQIYKFRQ